MSSLQRAFFTISWVATLTFAQIFLPNIQAYAQTSAPSTIQSIECLTDASLTCRLAIASSDLPDSLTVGQVIVQENDVRRNVISSEIKPGSVNFAAVLNINDRLRDASWVREVSSAIRAYPGRFGASAPTDQDRLTLFATRPSGVIVKQPVLWNESGGYGNLANGVQRILESGPLDSSARISAFTLLSEAVTSFSQVSASSAQVNHLLLVTDGNNLGSFAQREEIVRLAQEQNVRIHVFMLWVDTSKYTEDLNLSRLATETEGEYLKIRNINQAGSTTEQMNPIWNAMDQTRNRAFITYEMGNIQPTSLAVEIQTINGKTILARSESVPATGLQPPTVLIEASRAVDRTLEENQDVATLPTETIPFQIDYADGHPRPLAAGACLVNGVEVDKINAGEPLQCVLSAQHLVAGENKVEIAVMDQWGSVGKAESILNFRLVQPQPETEVPTAAPTTESAPTTRPTETAVPTTAPTLEPIAEPTRVQPERISFLGAVNGQIELTRTSDVYNAPVSTFLPQSWSVGLDLSPLTQSGLEIQCVEYQVKNETIVKTCESPFVASLNIETWGAEQYEMSAIVYDTSNNQVGIASVFLNLALEMPTTSSTSGFIRWIPWLIGFLLLGLLAYRRLRKREEGEGFPLPISELNPGEDDTKYRNKEDDSTAHVNRAPVRARLVLQPGNDVSPGVIYLRARTSGLWGAARSEWRLGRRANPLKCDPDCVIDDPRKQVSRHQVTVSEENGRFSIRDEGGASGTTLNGRQLSAQQWVPLSQGDIIKVDVVSYGFQIEDNPVPYQSPVNQSEQSIPLNPVSNNGYFGQRVIAKSDSRDHEDVTERVNHWNP